MQKTSVLFVNHNRHQCGVYQYGKRVFDILEKSTDMTYEYAELASLDQYQKAIQQKRYHTIIYNYHQATLPWLHAGVLHKETQHIGILHECDVPFFNKKISIDPNVPPFVPRPRLLLDVRNNNFVSETFERFVQAHQDQSPHIPIFGSFGFGFRFKGFHNIVEMVCQQYDKAVIKFVIPHADFDSCSSTVRTAIEECEQQRTKPGVKLMVHTDFVDEKDLLKFLASNTMNIFLYDRLDGRGISSTIDYALSVDTPFGISDSHMFRHVYNDNICLYKVSIAECIKNSPSHSKQFRHLYSHSNMLQKFSEIILST